MQNGRIINKSKFIYLIILLFFVPSVLLGQDWVERSKAFKTISISAHYLQNSNRNMFHNYWKPANGIDLNGESEFYFGKIELGTQIFSVKARKIEQPDFVAVNMYIGWGLDYKILSKLDIYSGFQVSNYYMNFDDDKIDVNLKSESEFSFGLKTGLKYNIGKSLFVDVSGYYQVIYTYHRIELLYISVGLGKTFETPKWLREFLN
ncbi:MAG: hypothetical protein DRP51_02125 [Candidatus Zixiibacteriota bacterium]|nr:MAG: hypothetical protein DRP51_02125 [candidate division Zixibacteria bacterium]